MIILGDNTPSREDSKRTNASRSEILTVGTKKKGGSTNPLDSRRAREGGMYRQGAALGTLTGWSFTETDLGHPAGDRDCQEISQHINLHGRRVIALIVVVTRFRPKIGTWRAIVSSRRLGTMTEVTLRSPGTSLE